MPCSFLWCWCVCCGEAFNQRGYDASVGGDYWRCHRWWCGPNPSVDYTLVGRPLPYTRDIGRKRDSQQFVSQLDGGDGRSKWIDRCGQTDEQEWIDKFVYQGFRQHGEEFLRALRGKFAVAFVDEERGELFLARDWMGEEPFHYVATLKSLIVGNTIADLKSAAAADYSYAYVRAFPQSHYQLIDLKDVRMGAVSATVHLATPHFLQPVWDGGIP